MAIFYIFIKCEGILFQYLHMVVMFPAIIIIVIIIWAGNGKVDFIDFGN